MKKNNRPKGQDFIRLAIFIILVAVLCVSLFTGVGGPGLEGGLIGCISYAVHYFFGH